MSAAGLSKTALTTVVAAICLLIAVPLSYLVIRVFEADDAGHLFWRARTVRLALHTVALAGVVTSVSLVLGVGLAVAAVRLVGGRPLMVGLLAAPLAVPSYVAGFAWTRLFPGFEGFWAAVLVLGAACYPLVLLPVAASLSASGRAWEDAARSLGRGPWNVFATVTLRRVRPAAAGGALLVALYALGDFGGPASVRFDSFTVGIYNAYHGSFDRTLPAVYSVALIAAALVLAGAERRLRRHDVAPITATERAPVRRHRLPVRAAAWTAMTGVLVVGIVIPVAALIGEIGRSRRLAARSVRQIVEWLWPDVTATVGYALVGAAAVTLPAIASALFTARPRRRGAGTAEAISYLGYALPGVTVGLAFVFVGIRLGRDFYLTPGLLIACYAVLFLPLAVGPIRAGFDATSGGVNEVSRTLGAGPWETLLRVRLPLVAPGIAAGALLAGLTIAKELPATLLLRPIGTQTLATHMWSLSNDLATGEAAVLGLVLIAVTALPTAMLSAFLFAKGGTR
ncbi:MAG: iron ABC transporter permease [Gordonia sp. (in: high G+C Gram-positive bacteria)]|uniref:ABC transporter permease n=1 Tax=Gordonia sp. (in: high G+C Gram-positive bacteria) TaxID=84139 RepID=UPI0039E4B39F